jgi:D-alanyl-D-alanine carboxypeptidase
MNNNHPMKGSLQTIIEKYVAKGLPGVQVAVKNKDGWYFTSGGYTKIEDKSLFHPHTPTWLFSITKTYTASLVMKQKEKGRINLDATINQYLPAAALNNVTGTDKITVRMLLNHSSGLVNFTELPAYQISQFNNPTKQPSINDILAMIKGKALISTPGEEYNYCNTNYLLLTLIVEKVSGSSFQQLLQEEIIAPLHLQHTYFAPTDERTTLLGFPNYYIDRHGNEQLENATTWNHAIGAACAGWGGIASTPSDAILFYEALMNGQVVGGSSLQEMKTWFKGKSSTEPNYGLGLEYFQYATGTTPQMGHEGDGIGNSTMLLYIPDNDTYLFMNITVGRQLQGPYLFKITDFKNELSKYVAQWR